ncbi:hypothetical protein IQ251_18825 [Saccharopolyspora sp. HNM0983]|uniref:Uncharacterized protein n=1 Tax=Saccharopolyspora montiporae TaxID=2781240 RepID=A0A929G1P6_9PSEU|nr:hypothetical protein [Saccharopolyspora sp. HNM0983]MBE9376509.1 hypothetical protein [Saccharopolyspora sp. HNM0983]
MLRIGEAQQLGSRGDPLHVVVLAHHRDGIRAAIDELRAESSGAAQAGSAS